MKPKINVQFWGTRGSIPRPGRNTVKYGGNTACVQITSPKGSLVVIDCGSGAYDLGQDLLAKAEGPLRGSILISHTHWDHIQGFPFFAPLFVRGGQWDIYGPAGLGQSLRETLAGQMQYAYFPVSLDEMGATIRFHDLVEGSFELDDIAVTTRYLNHPVLTLGYRLEMGGRSVVYACDHEPFSRKPWHMMPEHELDRQHAGFLSGADLVIHDAQFTDHEFSAKKGWGHSPVEYVSEVGQMAGVGQMAFTHHDPCRTDDELDQIVAGIRDDLKKKESSMQVFAAADGQVVELQVRDSPVPVAKGGAAAGLITAPAMKNPEVILGVANARMMVLLTEAAAADGVKLVHAADVTSTIQMAQQTPPALILVEDRLPGGDGLTVCRHLRAETDARLRGVPILIVGDRERAAEGAAAGVSEWLVTPFSAQFARAHIQAWLMRYACRWVRAGLPPDEDERLLALRGLSILDTPSENRFDRVTRVAAALAAVPIALVTLVDAERQWFKSCVGMDVKETSREIAFCAHVVVSRQAMIVNDTYLDRRFADNPLVMGGPRIRFYAGFPVFHQNGCCMGTLCLIDTRPRQFPETTIRMLRDLADLVQNELNSSR